MSNTTIPDDVRAKITEKAEQAFPNWSKNSSEDFSDMDKCVLFESAAEYGYGLAQEEIEETKTMWKEQMEINLKLNEECNSQSKEIERLKGLIEEAHEAGRLYSMSDLHGRNIEQFKQTHNL